MTLFASGIDRCTHCGAAVPYLDTIVGCSECPARQLTNPTSLVVHGGAR